MNKFKAILNASFARLTGYAFHKVNGPGGHAKLFASEVVQTLGIREVWDVGANNGQFFDEVSPLMHSRVRYKLFEPLPEVVNSLQKRFSNDSRVDVANFALSDVDESVTFYQSSFSPTSSLMEPSSEQQKQFPGSVERLKEMSVKARRIDSLLSESDFKIHGPALLKIDAQGAELKILSGAGSALGEFRAIYCECALISCYEGQPLLHELVGFLADKGFYVKGVGDVLKGASGVATQVDVLFVKD